MARVLTHHVNVRNPRTKKVETFEPGVDLPKWAAEALLAENHPAYPDETAPGARAAVKAWQASKAAAEAAAEAAAATAAAATVNVSAEG